MSWRPVKSICICDRNEKLTAELVRLNTGYAWAAPYNGVIAKIEAQENTRCQIKNQLQWSVAVVLAQPLLTYWPVINMLSVYGCVMQHKRRPLIATGKIRVI